MGFLNHNWISTISAVVILVQQVQAIVKIRQIERATVDMEQFLLLDAKDAYLFVSVLTIVSSNLCIIQQ